MSRSDIIGYTGVGMPPFYEMTLRAVSCHTTPPDLQFTVILDGFNAPIYNTLQLTRKAECVSSVANYNISEVGQLCIYVFLHCNFIINYV